MLPSVVLLLPISDTGMSIIKMTDLVLLRGDGMRQFLRRSVADQALAKKGHEVLSLKFHVG